MSGEEVIPRGGWSELDDRDERALPEPAAEPDPLAKITLTPRRFVAVLATAGLVIGLLLALLPVRVAGADPASTARVSCGNTIGGAETDSIAAGLGGAQPGQDILVSYVDICESAIAGRQLYSWPMFFAGGLVIIALGVVRRPEGANRLGLGL